MKDRMFRDAWVVGNIIEVDMAKAREIHKDNLRAARRPRLEALDIAYMQALEEGADTSEVVERKKVLRDVTADPRIAKASTPEALKALTLEGLCNFS